MATTTQSSASSSAEESARPSAWVALGDRDFVLVSAGQFVSLIGNAMQTAAVNWHVWNLTHDNLALGLVGLCRVIPIVILALYGGALSDAFDRRKLFAFTQGAMLVFSAARVWPVLP